MALSKVITKNNGVTTSYHKITKVTIEQEPYLVPENEKNVQLSVKLTSYFNKEYRDSNNPIESENYYFMITPEEEESLSTRKLAYAKLKTLSQWSDAEDC